MARAVLTDIEGTTTPIAFVHEVLFPYARTRLPAFLDARSSDPLVAALLAEVAAAEPGAPVETLLGWMDRDVKATPLKTLQGLIWREGYESGALLGRLYPDVAPVLRAWSAAGLTLFVYSSGSEEAQRLLFGCSTDGDLSSLFDGFFDTRIGPKREAASYRRICEAVRLDPADILFLSDVEAELDAAAAAGLATCQLVRPDDRTIASDRHPRAADFAAISL